LASIVELGWQRSCVMPEFFRSGAIMLMGLIVMAAGFAVVFYS
jgi:hypothetical protein